MFKLNQAKLTANYVKEEGHLVKGNYSTSVSTLWSDFSTNVLEGMVTDTSDKALNAIYREIYIYDTVSGPAVDLMSTLPWSEFTLSGISDPAVSKIFEECIEEIGVINLMTHASVNYLVLGRVIGSLLFNEGRGIFTDVIIHNPDDCEVTPIPLRGYDPKIDLKVSPDLKKFLKSKDPRDKEALKEIPPQMLAKLAGKSKIELEPLSTLYVTRSTVPGIESISYYTRILPLWLIEKALMRGTIIGAWRRQRPILHIVAGTDEWEATNAQLSAIKDMFVQADQDPQGAVIVTRPGIEHSEVRTGNDFWRLSDEYDNLSTAKMRALGINDSFLCLSGESLISHKQHGLVRLDTFYTPEMEKDHPYPIDIEVKGLSGEFVKADTFYYRGKAPCYRLITRRGFEITATENHKFLVLDNSFNLIWKRMKEINSQDALVLDKSGYTNEASGPCLDIKSLLHSSTLERLQFIGYYLEERGCHSYGYANIFDYIEFLFYFSNRDDLKVVQAVLLDMGFVSIELGTRPNTVDKHTLAIELHSSHKFYEAIAPYIRRKAPEKYTPVNTEIVVSGPVGRYGEKVTLSSKNVFFDSISTVLEDGEIDTFDLGISKEYDDSFVANGFIVHNSGEANYSTMEVSLSVFMNTLKTFREQQTRSILYDKVFLMLAKYHGFKKRTEAELTHNVRYDDNSAKYQNPYNGKVRMHGAKNLAEVNRYMIPTVHWNKDLSARSDQSYLDILGTAAEKGIPVPLAMIASAAGLNMTDVLNGLEEDIKIRKDIKEYQDNLKKSGLAPSGGESEDSNVFSSVQPEMTLTTEQASKVIDLVKRS